MGARLIAGAIIGGTSLLGGRGSVIGTMPRSILPGILSNAFILLRLDAKILGVSLGLLILRAARANPWRTRRVGA